MRIPYSISKNAMKSQQHKMNHIAHNIANVNTTGYKNQSVQFSELIYNTITDTDVSLSENTEGASQGTGTVIGQSKQAFVQGPLTETGDSMHLAISGSGFFGVRNEQGELLLTRDGAFLVNEDGNVVNDRGHFLELNGGNLATDAIPLFSVENSGSLEPAGGNMFRVIEGAEVVSSVGNAGLFGEVVSGYLEESTVDLAQSITDMIIAQRAYSLNAKVTQSTDEIYSLINQFN